MPIIFKHAPHFKRYREIATTLARHGLGWLALQLNLGRLIPFHWGLLGHPKRREPYTQAEHLRMALEELGTTFVKLGQILSTRPDLVPSEYVTEFSKLQDSAPPISYDEVAGVVMRELGEAPSKLFKSFDEKPRAAASIGQVHSALLKDGTPVVVKIERPGVEALVDQDLEILTELAKLAEKQTELGSYYDIVGWTAEFAFTLRNELDYTFEGHHADRIRQNFAGYDALHVPRIFWECTTKRVLTMEEISGIKINDIASLDKAGLDRKEIARKAAHIALTMTYDHGFFHADPHPGNFFVMPDESIGLIDFGMVGRLDENLRLSLIRLEMALIHKDVDRLVEELTTLGITGRTVKKHVLKRDVDHFLYRFYDKPLKEIGAADTFHALISIALRHRLQLPSDLVLLFKVIAMSEGLGAQLDPDFKLMEFAEPYFERFWLKNRSLGKQVRRIVEGTQELSELGFELPRHARGLIGQLERGEIAIVTHHEGLEEGIRELRKASSRVSMSILTASLVIGLGLLMLIYHPPGWRIYGGWFFAGLFVVVSLFGVGLLWQIWRSGRMR